MEKVPDSIRGYAFIDDDSAPRSSTSRSAAPPAPVQNKFSSLNDEEVEDDDAFDAPAPVPAKKQTVLSAMMPSSTGPSHPVAAPAAVDDEDAEDHEPIPVPAKKTTTTVKKVVKSVKKN
jgi:hypothetical protein